MSWGQSWGQIVLGLIAARKAKRWSQATLAKRLGVDLSAVSGWESGTSDPGIHSLIDWAQTLGKAITLEDLT